MSSIFLKLVNMSVSAGWLILAVVAFRLVLRRTPKAIICALWGLVAVRLLLPIHFESMFSLVPSAQTIPMNIAMAPRPEIDSGIAAIDQAVNPVLVQSMAPAELASANPLQIWIPVLTAVWLMGMAVMLTYALISYLRLCRRVRVSLRVEDNVYLCDQVESPFILGILRPRIYFPSDMAEGEYRYVLAHERAHLRRRDNLWKPIGYLLLCVYWFNPLCWLAYILLCRDIELACDEKALRSLGVEQKKAYSRALLSCSVSRGSIAACPVAFGMVGIKQRVQAVLHYKKPAFWVIQVGILACILVAVCFLTDPVQAEEKTAREHFDAYCQSFATGTAQETAELMWFPNEYVAELFFFNGYQNVTIDNREFEQINDDLWVATNVGSYSGGEYEYYDFVARMDDGWKVIQDVRDIPEQLRANLDSSLYDHHDDPNIMPRQPSALIQCYGELGEFAELVKVEADSSLAAWANATANSKDLLSYSLLELVNSTDCWAADYSGTSVGGTPEQFIRMTNKEGNTLVIRTDVDVLEVFNKNGRCIASYSSDAYGESVFSGREMYEFISSVAAQQTPQGETAQEHYEAYLQSFATGTAQETAELMWFPNEYVESDFLTNYYNESIDDTRKFEQINDDLWVATNVAFGEHGANEVYTFVARMDGGWKVIQDVRNIPEQLRVNLDSSLYDYHDSPDVMPGPSAELVQCYGELKKFADPVKIEVDSSLAAGENPYSDEDYPYSGSFLELVGSTDCWVADYSGTPVGGTPERYIRLTNAEGNTLVIRPDVDVLEVFDADGRCIASYVWEAWEERLPFGKKAYAFVCDWAAAKKAELESAAQANKERNSQSFATGTAQQALGYGALIEFDDPVKIEMDRPVAIDEVPFPDENYLGDGSIQDLLGTTGNWVADYSGTSVGGTPERYIRLTNAQGHTLVVRTDANELAVFDKDGRCIALYSCPAKSGKELYSFLCRWATQRKAELERTAQIEYFGTPNCDEFINLRKEPDASSESLLTIPLGTVFPVWKSENERFAVAEYGGARGYVNLDYVMRLSDCTSEQLFRCAAYVHGPATTEAVTQALTERYHQDPDRFRWELNSMSLSGWERFKAEETVQALLASAGVTLEAPKVTVLTRKTEDFEIDGLREETPENQEQWRDAVYTALWGAEAVEQVDSAAFGGVMVGISGGYFDYLADGSFLYRDMGAYVIRGEAARPLAALVQSVIGEKGIAPVQPQDLKGIRKATLVFGDVNLEVTDAATLAQIEKTLTQAAPISAPACWFTSLLTLELENGQSKTISIATDSCGVYHSDGTFFQFGHGNEDFYSLFGLSASDISG